jgi:hypothetical protein
MSLDPSPAAVQGLKDGISSISQLALPATVRAASIAPQLALVNKWVDHIPAVLESPNSSDSINAIFAIRKELFTGPQFSQCTLGIPLSDLPTPFQAFLNFIHKLIEAQKPEKEKTPVKVRIFHPSFYFIDF